MRPGCGEHSDPPRSPLEQLARRFLAPPSQGLRGLRMDEALERRQLDAPLAQVLGATSRLCPDCARTQPISAHLTSRRPVAGPVLTGLGWFQTGCVSAVLRLRT